MDTDKALFICSEALHIAHSHLFPHIHTMLHITYIFKKVVDGRNILDLFLAVIKGYHCSQNILGRL